VTPESGEVLFHAELSGGSSLNSTVANSSIPNRDASSRVAQSYGFTLNTRHKVKDMTFDGRLEY
jgi:hypothetical protein